MAAASVSQMRPLSGYWTRSSHNAETTMRILVTGALGCIGSWVTKSLLDRGLDPVLYDADSSLARLSLLVPSEDLKRVTLEVGVIEDTDRIKRLVREAGI